jgi:YHS domain-containing protein
MKYSFCACLYLCLFILVSCSNTDKPSIYAENNVAMKGYDLVAYIMDNDAFLGKEDFKANYEGVDFYFTRSSYRDEFLSNPTRYLPAYGGYCGYEVAQNAKKVTPDPTLWIVQDGKLIFFSDDAQLEGKRKAEWVVRRKEFLKKADEQWKELL